MASRNNTTLHLPTSPTGHRPAGIRMTSIIGVPARKGRKPREVRIVRLSKAPKGLRL